MQQVVDIGPYFIKKTDLEHWILFALRTNNYNLLVKNEKGRGL